MGHTPGPLRDTMAVIGPLVAVIAIFALAVIYGTGLSDAMTPEPVASEPTPPPCGTVWVVQPGDTPWSIASRCYQGEHTGQRAHEILALNGVDAGRLREGMVLELPERGR